MSTTSPSRLDVAVPPPPATDLSFPLLDTFRAIGALAVLTTHVAFWSGDYTRNGTWGTLLARLDVGVAIFFVLSGFLLSRPYLERAATGRPRPGAGRYLWKRALRILPVYLVAVVIALTFIVENRDMDLRERLVTALMLNTYTEQSNPAGLTHMWSLSVEVAFYLLLPLLMLVAIGRGRVLRPWRVLVLLGAMAALSVWWHVAGAAWAGEYSDAQPAQWLPAYSSWFAVGIGLALVQVLRATGRMERLTGPAVFLARHPGSCWALVGGLLLVAATPLAGPTMFAAPTSAQSLTKHVVYAAIGGLVVLTGVFVRPGSAYGRVLGHGVPRRIGWISYGIFALHLAMLHLVMHTTGWQLFGGRGLGIWVLTVVGTVLLAEVVYRVIERPALRLKNVRFRRRPAPPWEALDSSAEESKASTGTSAT